MHAFESAMALPCLDGWRRAAVFEPLADGGMGFQPLADLATAAFVGGRAAAAAGAEEERAVRGGHRDADLEGATAELRTQWGLDATAVLSCSTLAVRLGGMRRAQRALTVHVQAEQQGGRTRRTAKAAIYIKTVCLTNEEVVPAGAFLVAKDKVPTKLD